MGVWEGILSRKFWSLGHTLKPFSVFYNHFKRGVLLLLSRPFFLWTFTVLWFTGLANYVPNLLSRYKLQNFFFFFKFFVVERKEKSESQYCVEKWLKPYVVLCFFFNGKCLFRLCPVINIHPHNLLQH